MAKTTRTIPEINNDYFQTAALLGDLVWKVSKFTGEEMTGGQIGDLKRKLRTIDNEMDEAQREKMKEDRKAAELAKKETKTAGVPGMNGKVHNQTAEAGQAAT
jgi:hypothetical protein